MARCPTCDEPQPRYFSGSFDCSKCKTELRVAGSTLTAMILVPLVILVPGLILLKPLIGKGGVIALGIIGGHLLPWVCFLLWYRIEPTGGLDLSEARGVPKTPSWTRRVKP